MNSKKSVFIKMIILYIIVEFMGFYGGIFLIKHDLYIPVVTTIIIYSLLKRK